MATGLTIDSGDMAWMLVATVLVVLMLLPGLALFYGGLVRAKNLLSVMSQVLGITAIAILSWVLWNYSLAFSGGNRPIGGVAEKGRGGVGSGRWPLGGSGGGGPRVVFGGVRVGRAPST